MWTQVPLSSQQLLRSAVPVSVAAFLNCWHLWPANCRRIVTHHSPDWASRFWQIPQALTWASFKSVKAFANISLGFFSICHSLFPWMGNYMHRFSMLKMFSHGHSDGVCLTGVFLLKCEESHWEFYSSPWSSLGQWEFTPQFTISSGCSPPKTFQSLILQYRGPGQDLRGAAPFSCLDSLNSPLPPLSFVQVWLFPVLGTLYHQIAELHNPAILWCTIKSRPEISSGPKLLLLFPCTASSPS